jgi:hypothetical protein
MARREKGARFVWLRVYLSRASETDQVQSILAHVLLLNDVFIDHELLSGRNVKKLFGREAEGALESSIIAGILLVSGEDLLVV